MSEYINNKESRQKTIKEIIHQLHEGKTVDEVKQQFEESFQGVSASEISEAEGALIADGLPVSEVQRLCDVHAAVFKGSIEEIHQVSDPSEVPGHPLHTLKRENRELERIINEEIRPFLGELKKKENQAAVLKGLENLTRISLHYQKKENLFFPYMEQYGITAPPHVMWGVDDEIRAQIKEVKEFMQENPKEYEDLEIEIEAAVTRVEEMIFKEENIMTPMLLENLTQEEWKTIADESGEIGFLVSDIPEWTPSETEKLPCWEDPEEVEQGVVKLPTGYFHADELTAVLNTLPFDITYVGRDDTVRFFSQGKDRVFPRTKAIIGRNVSNCHPPASVHIVENIVEDFKSGKKDQEDFWIKMGGKYILIRYYAVRSEAGEYLGVLEVTEDINDIQAITGEKRLVE